MELERHFKLEKILATDNIATLLDDEELKMIGGRVVEDFDIDDASRQGRKKAMVDANKLAMLVREEKTFPWPGAANVKFPLLAIGALQFSARAYPSLISGTDVVKCRTIGSDPQGLKAQRAQRVSQHMSYQVLEQDEHWEEEMDRLLMTLPITGTVVKKTYQDTMLHRPVSCMVMPLNFVVPYYTKSIEEAERKTEILFRTPRQIENDARRGKYLDVELTADSEGVTESVREIFMERGLEPAEADKDRTRILLEQYRYIDLDGDGYEEPYGITVDYASGKVLRIFACFSEKDIETDKDGEIAEIFQAGMQAIQAAAQSGDMGAMQQLQSIMAEQIEALKKKSKIIHIKAIEYYTKYSFIPSPDGCFYDLGFGDLLAPINESINTVINQLLDNGTMQVATNGFLGRGVKIKGGSVRLKPFE